MSRKIVIKTADGIRCRLDVEHGYLGVHFGDYHGLSATRFRVLVKGGWCATNNQIAVFFDGLFMVFPMTEKEKLLEAKSIFDGEAAS